MVIWDLDKNGETKVIPTGEFEPEWIMWKSDSRLIAALVINPEVSYPARLWRKNARMPYTRIIAFDADGSHLHDLVSGHTFKEYLPSWQPLVSLLHKDKDHILVSMHEFDQNLGWQRKPPELFKININTGNSENLSPDEKNISKWTTDADGNARLRSYCSARFGLRCEDKTITFQVRNLSDNTWQTIQSIERDQPIQFYPVAFVDNVPDQLYVLSNHQAGLHGLYKFDTGSKSFLHPVVTSTQSIAPIKGLSDRLIGYRIGENAPIYIDAAFAKEALIANRALPDTVNTIVDISDDDQRVLLEITKGNEPTNYWLLDRSSGKTTLSPLTNNYPDLKSTQIAPTQMVTYKARDGLDIPALLTLPPGDHQGPDSPALAFAVLPHGGPTENDVRGFDYLVQFLASRGYGVLQPQFRGSTGYGEELKQAGKQQWALAMQDDITDGTKWLVQKKLADPARIAIVGTSGYGGYAALMGAIKEPYLYRCAVALSAITDLELLIETRQHYLFNDNNMPGMDTNATLLEAYSPTRNAEKIQIPVFLVHGRKDFTVPVEHTEAMSNSLREAGKTFEVLYLKEADHNLSHADDRISVLSALEKFLSVHLSVQAEPTDPPATRATSMSNRVEVLFELERSGKLIRTEIVSSSGNKSLDQAAINAVKSATYKGFPDYVWAGSSSKVFRSKVVFDNKQAKYVNTTDK